MKKAKTVLNLALGLAARYEAIPKNPVREAKRMRKPQAQAVSLTHEQVEAIRQEFGRGDAAQVRRRTGRGSAG